MHDAVRKANEDAEKQSPSMPLQTALEAISVDAMREKAQSLAPLALDAVERVLRDKKSGAAAVISAANVILERGYGKPKGDDAAPSVALMVQINYV